MCMRSEGKGAGKATWCPRPPAKRGRKAQRVGVTQCTRPPGRSSLAVPEEREDLGTSGREPGRITRHLQILTPHHQLPFSRPGRRVPSEGPVRVGWVGVPSCPCSSAPAPHACTHAAPQLDSHSSGEGGRLLGPHPISFLRFVSALTCPG